MRFILVGAFNLHDGYLGAANALREMGHVVEFVPALKYKAENLENPEKQVELIIKDVYSLGNIDDDIILWWRAETLNGFEFRQLREAIKGKFIMFSWDDPLQWEKHPEMPEKSSILDAAFSCCFNSVSKYERSGCKAFYTPPGFDPSIHYPEEDDNYKCDISIVCTHLYEGTSVTRYPHLSRKLLLDSIIEMAPNLDLRIYGTEEFKNIYGERYKGWISFNESRKVFYNSKINICTHIRPDGEMYINERVCQILGSGGLLFVDPVKGLNKALGERTEYIPIDFSSSGKFVSQIKDILSNYEPYWQIRKNGLWKAIHKFTWRHWAKKICDGVDLCKEKKEETEKNEEKSDTS